MTEQKLSKRALNRATLARQLLFRREKCSPEEAVRRSVALQAQEPASPYVALWNRVDGFAPTGLDDAFTSLDIVKSNSIRLTLHAVIQDEFITFRQATDPSLRSRLGDRRFSESGLTVKDAEELVTELLEFARDVRTASECESWLTQRLGFAHAGAWWGLRQYAPWLRAPTGGPWSFEQRVSYLAPPQSPRLGDAGASERALRDLALRYLEGFGPASVADVAQFALVQRTRVRNALQPVMSDLVRYRGPGGEELLDLPGLPVPSGDEAVPPRLLGMWDNVLLAYQDRSRIIPEEYRRVVIRNNGDVLPTLLIDGFVAGVWRHIEGGIEARAFGQLPATTWEELAHEASGLLAMLEGRDDRLFGRYGHWWEKLPPGETRLLAWR